MEELFYGKVYPELDSRKIFLEQRAEDKAEYRSFMKRAARPLIFFLLLSVLAAPSAEAWNRKVSEIKRRPSFYHRDRISVEGYVVDAKYIQHGERAILAIKLYDENKKEFEELELEEKCLLCQEDGYNIGILSRVFDITNLLMKKGIKIVVKGKYDENMDMFYLEKIRYERAGKKYKIDTDEGDYHLPSLFRELRRKRGIIAKQRKTIKELEQKIKELEKEEGKK